MFTQLSCPGDKYYFYCIQFTDLEGQTLFKFPPGEVNCQGPALLEARLLPAHDEPPPHAPHPHHRHQRQVRAHRCPWGHFRHHHLQRPLLQDVVVHTGGATLCQPEEGAVSIHFISAVEAKLILCWPGEPLVQVQCHNPRRWTEARQVSPRTRLDTVHCTPQ